MTLFLKLLKSVFNIYVIINKGDNKTPESKHRMRNVDTLLCTFYMKNKKIKVSGLVQGVWVCISQTST